MLIMAAMETAAAPGRLEDLAHHFGGDARTAGNFRGSHHVKIGGIRQHINGNYAQAFRRLMRAAGSFADP